MNIKKLVSERMKGLVREFLHPVPKRLRRNQIKIDNFSLNAIKKSIEVNYHAGWKSKNAYLKEMYEKDLKAHLYERLEIGRKRIVPWLDNAKGLENSSILEIGCGTGSSTVALAEQGAKVIGIDIDEGALQVAKDRCKIYGLEVELMMLNATNISNTFLDAKFDSIIFFACIEHMTIEERLTALKSAWDILRTGGLLVIIETPNRLWYFDDHTSQLPFFHWLPNELAFKYSRFSARENFRELYRQYDATSKKHFLRRGRGVSFHELDIAIKPASDLRVVSSLSTFEGVRYRLGRSKLERRFKSILRSIYPGIHEGFFDSNLDLIIEKD